MTRLVIAGLAAVAIGAFSATVAFAQPKFNSQVTIKFSAAGKAGPAGYNFIGRVKSEKNACEPQRKVILYGRATEHGDPERLGSDRTNANGEWAVNHILSSDSYFYAKATKTDISAGVCEPARSKQLHPG